MIVERVNMCIQKVNYKYYVQYVLNFNKPYTVYKN